MTKHGVGLDGVLWVDASSVKKQAVSKKVEKPVLIGISGGHQIFRVNGKIVIQ